MNAALLATFNKQARHLLNEQRHAARALADPLDNSLSDSACCAAISPTMRRTCSPVEWRKRNDCMV